MGIPENCRPVVNPSVVLREEFDDWAILFDPDANVTFGINPVGVLVWKSLDGKRTIREILHELREACEEVPEGAEDHLAHFIEDLIARGLASRGGRE
ncbi:MAG: SynChlorMet cassette protein ScmD [Deltaproteobacteria bacterium]|nr:SynChlorMet cassette protein ScmD [Deltaproteobacteria bacterium]